MKSDRSQTLRGPHKRSGLTIALFCDIYKPIIFHTRNRYTGRFLLTFQFPGRKSLANKTSVLGPLMFIYSMKTKTPWLKIIAAILGIGAIGSPAVHAAAPFSVPTYHCLSVYWTPTNNEGGEPVSIKYRVTGEQTWHNGYPMVYNPVASPSVKADYRGSLVNLQPDTSYDISLQVGTRGETAEFTAQTQSENYPIATAIKVGDRTTTMAINSSGTADGYILYDGTGSTIDLNNLMDDGITVNGSYIIIRGFTIRNLRNNGINILNGNNIVIENCDISQWGDERPDEIGYGVNMRCGIYSYNPAIYGVTVQRCKIHNPNWPSTFWIPGVDVHPEGPQTIGFLDSVGRNVIRYNECWSDADHYFNDTIGYGHNPSYEGFPGPDSDIYCNYIASAHDDGIEAEGGNQNVRIWGNYFENNYISLGNAPVAVGPLYVWRNIFGSSETFGVKMGWAGGIYLMTGQMYFFNNTMLNTSGGLGAAGYSRDVFHCVTRNNIFNVNSVFPNSISVRTTNYDNDYNYDLYSAGVPTGSELSGTYGIPSYLTSPLFTFATKTGDFRLSGTSLGLNAGIVIDNFCEVYQGAGVDMGAQEEGTSPMVFGVNASFNPPPTNIGPIVTASPLVQNALLTPGAVLHGRADWIPSGQISVAWSKVSGPGTVTFADPNAKNTTATFSALGTYVLRFTASDSQQSDSQDVTVIAKANGTPTALVNSTTQTVALEAPSTLIGTVTDDSLPGPLTLSWARVSGTGTVSFSDGDLLCTSATYSQIGTYTLKFKAYDTPTTYGARNVTVTVVNNAQPHVTASPSSQPIALSGTASLSATATDDGLPQPLVLTWLRASGPGTVTFSSPHELTTKATFSLSGTYAIKFKASDSLLYGAKNVTVIVSP